MSCLKTFQACRAGCHISARRKRTQPAYLKYDGYTPISLAINSVFNSGDVLHPVQPENTGFYILPIMFLRSHDEFSAPGLLAGKSEKPGH
ncbi:TPA: hypothetical protein G8M64_004071 [Salmonella enterica]|nr:hypothetical protein [Salmonella enterica]